ncbi:MAG: presenilin family intramembrane aspartyl protease PSH [Methanomicrobiales archaeon]|nr:presenilin family intramembrane aspartyl protease PSH [Methanomicrobiales archaeon]MDI6875335.1 presenilin family intramembrane aspartyl protease PSH [Methanomicrobiales archaeon]
MDIQKLLPFLGMPALLIAVEILALLLSSPLQESGAMAFEDPSAVENSLIFIFFLLVMTAIMLILIRVRVKWFIKYFIAFAIATSLFYVFLAIATILTGGTFWGFVLSIMFAIIATVILYKYPEWYVIDAFGILIAAGVASIFGISLAILPVLILLVLLAVYDAISVYRTRHMITLAEGVLETKAPILFVIPKKADYSFVREGVSMQKGERGAFIMGMGDLIMPTILVVSANVFLRGETTVILTIPALGAMAGSFVGLAVLMHFVSRGRPQAGLPPLNAGTIGGFLLGCAIAGAWGWVPFV